MIPIKKRYAVARAAALVVLAGAVGFGATQVFAGGSAEEPERERLHVVATHSIIGDFVENVAGDAVELTVLAGVNQDPHVYEPAPADSAAVLGADLVFENGLLLKGWLDPLYRQSGSTATRVVVSDGARLLDYAGGHDDHGHDDHGHDDHGHDDHGHDDHGHDDHGHDDHSHGHDHDHDHVHGEYDPHVWQSVANAIVMVENIRDALVDADPANASGYEDNAAAYIAELEELDDYIFELAEMIPHERRILVTGHLAYQYFADRYGFRQLGATLGAITTEGADPSAGEIAALIDEIRKTGAPAVFAENIMNSALAQQVAGEAEVAFVSPIYSGAIDEPGSDAASYIGMMRHNIEIMVDALAE